MADETGGDVLSGAAMGASAGASAGPYGALIGGVIGAGYGLYQSDQNKKNQRPKYTIPPEIYQNLTQAQQQALQGLPEAQKQEYIKNLERSEAYSLREAGNRKAGLTGLAALNQNSNDAMAHLTTLDAQARQQNIQNLYSMRNQLADYRGEEFQLNKLNPYYEERARQNAQQGATQQNFDSAGAQLGTQYKNKQATQPNPSINYSGQQQPPQAPYVPQYKMDENQMQGVNQNTTPDPYANQQQLQGALPTYGNQIYNNNAWGQ